MNSLFEDNSGPNAYMSLDAAVWSNTSPITSITLTSSGTAFAQYSTFELYGISNQPATAAPSGTTTIGVRLLIWVNTKQPYRLPIQELMQVMM